MKVKWYVNRDEGQDGSADNLCHCLLHLCELGVELHPNSEYNTEWSRFWVLVVLMVIVCFPLVCTPLHLASACVWQIHHRLCGFVIVIVSLVFMV